jgi:GTP-binding protein HflX
MPGRETSLVPGTEPERGLCVVVVAHGADPADELNEISELMRTAGVEPVGAIVQHRSSPDPRTYIGKGKLEELKTAVQEEKAETVIVDDELDPSQQRRLEDALDVRVVDRTQLILDIFAQHAVTAEGRLQVELAQLDYNLPRMRGMWKHLERLGGGAGAGRRGPGESQLETDRRLARARISVLKKRLKALERRRSTQRKERRQAATPLVALAGYTNAGKSTLLNALTNADVSVNDRLFETLDPTTRAFVEDGRRYLVTDTVGFIRRLPHGLVEGFAATLEETLLADLILHVVDASAPEPRLADTIRAVEDVLAEIDATHIPQELVLNKIDALDGLSRRRLANRYPDAVQISAQTGEGLDLLRERVAARLADLFEPVRLVVPYSEGKVLADLYELGAPIEEREDREDGVHVLARLPRAELGRYAPFLVVEERPAAERGR